MTPMAKMTSRDAMNHVTTVVQRDFGIGPPILRGSRLLFGGGPAARLSAGHRAGHRGAGHLARVLHVADVERDVSALHLAARDRASPERAREILKLLRQRQ